MNEKNNKKYEEIKRSIKDTLGNQGKAIKLIMERVQDMKTEMEVMNKTQTEGHNIPKPMGHNESSAKTNIIALSAHIKKMEKDHISDLTAYLKTLEQKEADSLSRSRRQEIIKLRAEINKIETKKTIQRINETKRWFFEKINKIDKPLFKLIKKQREGIQINKIRKEKWT